jgi:hypothetical protein
LPKQYTRIPPAINEINIAIRGYAISFRVLTRVSLNSFILDSIPHPPYSAS